MSTDRPDSGADQRRVVLGYGQYADDELVRLVAAAEPGALEAVYDRYGAPAYALARRIVGDEQLAQDVVQEVFLALWRQASRFDPGRGALASWLLTLTHHKAVDVVRREEPLRRRRVDADVLETTPADDRSVDEEVWSGVRRDRVRAALAGLPDAQRRVLELAYFGGHSQRQIALLTDTPLGTVKTRMLLGMRRLRGELFGVSTAAEDEAGAP